MEVSGPFGGSGASLPDDPLPDRDNESDLLDQWNERGWRDHAFFRMIPANQGLESADFIVRQIYHRLIIEFELASRQGLAQVPFHDAAGLHLQVHRRLEEAECTAPVALGAVEREVRIP